MSLSHALEKNYSYLVRVCEAARQIEDSILRDAGRKRTKFFGDSSGSRSPFVLLVVQYVLLAPLAQVGRILQGGDFGRAKLRFAPQSQVAAS